MTTKIANQIAELLNNRNQLTVQYTEEKALANKDNYVYILDFEKVIACAESKKVQWYQWEVSHVSVAKDFEGKGFGNKILLDAERKARAGNARILQCTNKFYNSY
ncbi:GNAT family N-acetyltransferase [Flavobacterium phycosphaerae]|uniref:GNAT family N-acetyltransferase n=1 Tax=Flavobacterium phycosphaerae TaxID=2697515 RepID=UPI001389D1AF|nr:GNAT family N-acetyltransferase [Flavobacterium phycosphaerae]